MTEIYATIKRLLSAVLCACVLTSCNSLNGLMGGTSEEEALKALKWTYQADGVQIHIVADARLNESNGDPHTLALSVVQMEDPSVFAPYAANTAELSMLLLANNPPRGLLALDRIFVSPSETRTVAIPRVEKAKYVGLAAGYYHLDPARSLRLYRIGVEVDSSGILVQTRNAFPEPLKIDLLLGSDGILDSPGTRTPPVTSMRPTAGEVPAVDAQSAAGGTPSQ